MTARIVLDISRLLSRADCAAPTGIDRVEMAYAKQLIASRPDQLSFAAMSKWGLFGPLPQGLSTAFVQALDASWRGEPMLGTGTSALAQRLQARLLYPGARTLRARLQQGTTPAIYLLVSHHHLDRTGLIGRLKAAPNLRFVCLVHDLIPIELPEYARPGQTRRHHQRLRTVSQWADGVIVNSDSTGSALSNHLQGEVSPPILVAPLGAEPLAFPSAADGEAPRHPYFVVLSTIEPKKNHLLLLHLWRRMASKYGEHAPRLVLIGQRGWMNQNIVDMLERSPAIRRLVDEHNNLADAAVGPLLRGARALLHPSFAEGYGLPVAEALSLGVPVICSDLPALRAAGQDAPEYLDPLDGPAWEAAIMDYTSPTSVRRTTQLARLARYAPPGWPDHFSRVMPFLDQIAR